MSRVILAEAINLFVSGFRMESIVKHLEGNGYTTHLIEFAINAINNGHFLGNTSPRNFDYIKPFIRVTLLEETIDEIMQILTFETKYGCLVPLKDVINIDLEQYIEYYKTNKSEKVLKEIFEFFQPYFECIMSKINSNIATKPLKNNQLEEYILSKWYEFFGLWTCEMVVAAKGNNPSEENLILSETCDNIEYGYCKKYKTEINVENVCKIAECIFFDEQMSEDGELTKFCKFTI
jgi:hypothetical protein